MEPVPPERFASALRDLDGPSFAALVADLWARSGWETEREGQLVVARRRDRTRRLHVRPPRRLASLGSSPSGGPDADVVVTAERVDDDGAASAVGQSVVDADDLRERALYALDPAERSAFFDRHLGIPPTASNWGGPQLVPQPSEVAPSALSPPTALSERLPDALGRSGAVRAVGLVAVLIVALVAVQAGALGPVAFDDDLSSDESTSADRASAAGTDGDADSEPGLPAAYDVEPTCERVPGEVARVLSDAFEAGETAPALHTYWDFANPDFKQATSYRRYASMHRSAFENVVGAESISLEEPVEVDDRVHVNATVSHERSGSTSWQYVFEHREEPPNEGCWVVNSFSAE